MNVLTTCGHTVGLKQSPSVVFSSSSDLAVEKQGVNQQPSSEEASLTEGLTNETSKDELETQQVSGECCLLISVMCCLLVWNYPQCFASCKVIRNGTSGTWFRIPCQWNLDSGILDFRTPESRIPDFASKYLLSLCHALRYFGRSENLWAWIPGFKNPDYLPWGDVFLRSKTCGSASRPQKLTFAKKLCFCMAFSNFLYRSDTFLFSTKRVGVWVLLLFSSFLPPYIRKQFIVGLIFRSCQYEGIVRVVHSK